MTPPPDTYYEMLSERLPWHGENVEDLKARAVLMDGAPTADGGLLLQILPKPPSGPSSLRLSSVKATKVSVRVISRHCLKAWSVIRFVEVSCRKTDFSGISQVVVAANFRAATSLKCSPS